MNNQIVDLATVVVDPYYVKNTITNHHRPGSNPENTVMIKYMPPFHMSLLPLNTGALTLCAKPQPWH